MKPQFKVIQRLESRYDIIHSYEAKLYVIWLEGKFYFVANYSAGFPARDDNSDRWVDVIFIDTSKPEAHTEEIIGSDRLHKMIADITPEDAENEFKRILSKYEMNMPNYGVTTTLYEYYSAKKAELIELVRDIKFDDYFDSQSPINPEL